MLNLLAGSSTGFPLQPSTAVAAGKRRRSGMNEVLPKAKPNDMKLVSPTHGVACPLDA